MGIMSLKGGFFNKITRRAVEVEQGGGHCQNPLNWGDSAIKKITYGELIF